MTYDIPIEDDSEEPEQPTLLRIFLMTHRPCPVCRADGRVLRGGVWCECPACHGDKYERLSLVQKAGASHD